MHKYITLGLMALVIVGLLMLHYTKNREPERMSYYDFQHIW